MMKCFKITTASVDKIDYFKKQTNQLSKKNPQHNKVLNTIFKSASCVSVKRDMSLLKEIFQMEEISQPFLKHSSPLKDAQVLFSLQKRFGHLKENIAGGNANKHCQNQYCAYDCSSAVL